MNKSLDGKIALVTGASRGIGYAAARELALRGAHIVAVARTIGGLEALDDEIQAFGGTATLTPLDLRDGDQIDRVGAAIAERWGRLDILVGNAAMLGILGPLAHLEPEVWDELFAVNVTANYRLVRSVDPLLHKAENAKVLFITSNIGSTESRAFWAPYAASKAALDIMVQSYAAEVEKAGLVVNLLNPGAVATAMRAQAMPGEDPATLRQPADIAPLIVDMVSPGWTRTGALLHYADLA